ncbi:MAG: hypothetical protein KJ645_03280, partial [Planctomycetes bacterium]|nr:hypothetical protein [Planctomycetota bacterium]
MKIRLISILLICLLGGLAAACKVTGGDTHSKPGSATYVDLKTLMFTTQSVFGQVQIKASRNEPWHDLQPGEVFNGYALIRSGFQSGADLVMRHGNRSLNCELGALICAVSINDIYDRILSPSALAEYKEKVRKKDYRLDPKAPVCISREALNRFEKKEGLLATADGASLMKGGDDNMPGAP